MRLTHDEVETIRIHINAFKENLCNQHRWKEAEEYQSIVDKLDDLMTVDAIPVDFIESWIDSNLASTEDRDFYAEDCIRSLVQDWRKKNERCNSHRLYKKQNRL